MPESPKNKPLSTKEALTSAFAQVDQLMAEGSCEQCALRVVANRTGVDYGRLMILHVERPFDGTQE